MSEVDQIEFVGTGGHALAGRVHAPAVKPSAWAVFAHCFSGSKESRAGRYISSALTERGIATLLSEIKIRSELV